MFLRPLIDYDVRLRYYIVQARKARAEIRASPAGAIGLFKMDMHAAREWDNANAKLGHLLTTYPPDTWPDEERANLEEAA